MNEQKELSTDGADRVVVTREGGALSNAPWWMVSVGIHMVLLLGATLVAIESAFSIEEPPVQVIVSARPTTPLFDKI